MKSRSDTPPMAMHGIDCAPFCSRDISRPYLAAPFSRGGHSYALDGRVVLRMPRDPAVAGLCAPASWVRFDPDAPFANFDAAADTMAFPRAGMLPRPVFRHCAACSGSPVREVCEACDGLGGAYDPVSVECCGQSFALHYLSAICDLPLVRLARKPVVLNVGDLIVPILYFSFAAPHVISPANALAGVGALAGLSRRHDTHLHIDLFVNDA